MKNREICIDVICVLFIVLFVYAALSKLIDHDNFIIQLGKSPLLTAWVGPVSWMLPIAELVVAILLVPAKTRFGAMLLSLALMSLFTTYIIVILGFSEFIPCSCGGILDKLTWGPHLAFNLAFVSFAIFAIALMRTLMRATWWAFAVIGSSILIVGGLYRISYDEKSKYSSFDRMFAGKILRANDSIDIKFNSYYLAGIHEDSVYLGNEIAFRTVLSVDTLLNGSSSHIIDVDTAITKRKLRLSMRNSNFFLSDGISPAVLNGTVGTWRSHRVDLDSVFFNDFMPLGRHSFAMRIIRADKRQLSLVKAASFSPRILPAPGVLKPQLDGIFSVDGSLAFDEVGRRTVYVYRFRNQYAVMDSALSLLYYGRTIDTIRRAKISFTKTKSGSTQSLAANSLVVNRHACLSGNRLLINSGIRARNQDEEAFSSSTSLDMYDLTAGRYLRTFVLPIPGLKIRSMILRERALYVLYESKLFKFALEGY